MPLHGRAEHVSDRVLFEALSYIRGDFRNKFSIQIRCFPVKSLGQVEITARVFSAGIFFSGIIECCVFGVYQYFCQGMGFVSSFIQLLNLSIIGFLFCSVAVQIHKVARNLDGLSKFALAVVAVVIMGSFSSDDSFVFNFQVCETS